jgi:hypothetical protein
MTANQALARISNLTFLVECRIINPNEFAAQVCEVMHELNTADAAFWANVAKEREQQEKAEREA